MIIPVRCFTCGKVLRRFLLCLLMLFAAEFPVTEPCGPAGHWQQVGYVSRLASGGILRIVSCPLDIAPAPFSIALKQLSVVEQLSLSKH